MLALLMLAACSTHKAREYLDPQTAATITVAGRGWVFARERTDLAVHAQDYITITPVQLNRNGQRTLYLYCHVWSTIDRLADKSVTPKNAALALLADDRRIPLPVQIAEPRKLGFGRAPVAIPNKAAELRALPIDPELLGFIAHADRLRISVTTGESIDYFLLWRDGREATEEFLRQIAAR
jgi:hypothetical protein